MDWFASGLPREGALAGTPRAADVARRDVPTCGTNDRIGDVARRAREAGWDVAVVVDGQSVVLGLLDEDALRGEPARSAGAAMRPAPVTVRPHVTVEELVESLQRRRRDRVLVTTSDGRLIGLARQADAERCLAERAATREPVSR